MEPASPCLRGGGGGGGGGGGVSPQNPALYTKGTKLSAMTTITSGRGCHSNTEAKVCEKISPLI